MRSARVLAARAISDIVSDKNDKTFVEAREVLEKDFPKDVALFEKIVHGVLKEWFWLEHLLNKFAEKKSASMIQKVCCFIGSYQLLFLDRVPTHAIYSELKNSFKELNLSDPQFKFAHAFLKKVENSKEDFLKERQKLFNSESESFWSEPKPLLDALTIVLPEERDALGSLPKAKKFARQRAIAALKIQNGELPVYGYQLSDSKSLLLENDEHFFENLKEGKTRVQGLSSQMSCEYFSDLVFKEIKQTKGKRKIRILEMATGKGGKCLRTLSILKQRFLDEKVNSDLPLIEWVAADSNLKQIKMFDLGAMPLIEKNFKHWVTVRSLKEDWSEPEKTKEQFLNFDFIWIDAPCTGFGTISKNPQIPFLRGENAFAEATKMALIQKQLCSVALTFKPTHLFYSVCTLTKPETLDIETFLTELNSSKTPKIEQKWIWPDENHEGFYWLSIS